MKVGSGSTVVVRLQNAGNEPMLRRIRRESARSGPRRTSRANLVDYRKQPFTLDEINALLRAAREHRPEWEPYWQFAFFTGLRTSELYGLKWGDFSWGGMKFRVQRATVMRQEKETKTEASVRDVILLPMALQAINEQKSYSLTWSDYVFINPRIRRPFVDYEETGAVLTWLQRKAGVRYGNQYQTRHTYASQLLSGGENVYRVAAQLGHRSVEMVMRVYGKWIEQGDRQKQVEFDSEFGRFGTRNGAPVARGNSLIG